MTKNKNNRNNGVSLRDVSKIIKELNLKANPNQKKGKPFRKTGGTIGSIFGPMGKNIGKMAGSALGTLFGSGDYSDHYINSVHTNSIINPNGSVPAVFSGEPGRGGVVVRRREYLTDIISAPTANTYLSKTYSLNPGLSSTFPWLANIAANYDQYRIRGMFFEFESLSGDATASVATGLGYVAMATQYDALDPPLSNKMELENYDMAQSCKPSRSQIHGIECKKFSSVLDNLYIRTGDNTAGSDLRMYDFGTFNIATSAPGTSVTLGQLYVSYDIELTKPKLTETFGGDIKSYHYTTVGIAGGSAPLTGTSGTISSGSLGITLDLSLRTISWTTNPECIWNVSLFWNGTAQVITAPAVTLNSAISYYGLLTGGSVAFGPPNGVTSSSLLQNYFLRSSSSVPPNSTAVMTLGNAGTIPTNATLHIVITQLDSSVTV